MGGWAPALGYRKAPLPGSFGISRPHQLDYASYLHLPRNALVLCFSLALQTASSMGNLHAVKWEANRTDRGFNNNPHRDLDRFLSSPLGKLQTQVALVVVHAIMSNLGCGDTECQTCNQRCLR